MLLLLLACAHPVPPAPPAGAGGAPSEASFALGPERPAPPASWRLSTRPSLAIEPDDAVIGPEDARFTIVSFSDYFCPYCASFWPKIHALITRNPDARLVLKNWPIDPECNPSITAHGHRFACVAAAASECATRQGATVAMADLLYTYPEHVTPTEIATFADRAGLDRSAFESCLVDPTIAASVSADIQSGIDAGLEGTPSVYIWGVDPDVWVEVPPSDEIIEVVLQARRAGLPLD